MCEGVGQQLYLTWGNLSILLCFLLQLHCEGGGGVGGEEEGGESGREKREKGGREEEREREGREENEQ